MRPEYEGEGARTLDEYGVHPWMFHPPIIKEAKRFMYKGIAISGKMCAGKTSLARHISSQVGWPIQPLAGELKRQIAQALYDNGVCLALEDIIAQNKGELRGTMQEWGALFRKWCGEDYWVNKLLALYPEPIVVDDVRYPNELEKLQRVGFLMVRIEVDRKLQLDRIEKLYPDLSIQQLTHLSETALDSWTSKFDVVVPGHLDGVDTLTRWWDEWAFGRFDFQVGGKRA